MKNIFLIGLFGVLGTAPSLVISAGFSIDGATVTLTGPTRLSTTGDVTLSQGAFDAGSAHVYVGGNWRQVDGTFVPGTSIVTFQGASTSTFSGSTAFYSLQCMTPGKTLIFTAGSTQNVLGSLALTGAAGSPIFVRSSVPGSYGSLINSGANTLTHVDARDNDAEGGITLAAGGASVDSGHTLNWSFGSLETPPPITPLPVQFYLLPGSPYPRLLTPNRPENRRLFFLFNNPDNDPVQVTIYDFHDRKIRDLNSSASTPIPGAVVVVAR